MFLATHRHLLIVVKRSKTAVERMSDFKFGMGVIIKADRDCAASGCLKSQCVSN